MKEKEMITDWDPELGIAKVTIFDSHNIGYTGYAYCAEEDKDFKSKLTGLHLAEYRANIKKVQQEIQYCQERLNGLKAVYYSVIDSKGYDKNNVVSKRLYKHMKMTESELDFWKSLYRSGKNHIHASIKEKDKLYKRLRENRKLKEDE